MALPKQVEDQLRELEKIEKQLAAEQNQGKDQESDPEPDEALAEPTTSAEPEQDTQPVETKPEPAEPEVAEETWQQKYRTLKGMYDAEVPRLHSDLRDLKTQVEKLQRVEPPKEEKKPAKREPLVTEADVEAFGSDLIEVQRKVAREVASEFRDELDTMKAENDQLREQLTSTGNKVSEASFEQRLHRLVPDFQEINADPKWIAWLNEVDPLLRAPRMSVAQDVFNRGDVEGVAHYIGLFKDSVAPVEQITSDKNSRTEELERQLQPKRSSSSALPTDQRGRIYTNADIQRMFKKAADLGGAGKIDQAVKLEAEIDKAYMENRVTA
tara:strand:- start:559 stop:1536 length:978 start_codon:yes stop_codon:yes gene_type:complete